MNINSLLISMFLFFSQNILLGVISDGDSFYNYLKSAVPGDTLYIEAGVEINLSGKTNISIPENISIIGLGKDETGFTDYPLIFSDYVPTEGRINPLFLIDGNNVVISGIRLRGDLNINKNDEEDILLPGSVALKNKGYSNTTIKNCEIYNWQFSGIYFDSGSRYNLVLNNRIHSNLGKGYGYGVCIGSKSFATVEHNNFDNNRHSIAGGGCPDSGYQARYNYIGERGTSHSFDMHGGVDRKDGTDYAGCCIIIEYNDFHIINHWAIAIRGVPKEFAIIRHNNFYGDKNFVRSNAARQLNAYGNMYVGPNYYDYNYKQIKEPGWIVLFAGAVDPVWLLHTRYSFSDVDVGDFNGDGISDIFVIDSSGRWLVSWAGLVSWQVLNEKVEMYVDPDNIHIADFNNNGIDDVLIINDNDRYLSVNGSGPLIPVDKSQYNLQDNLMRKHQNADLFAQIESKTKDLPFPLIRNDIALYDFNGDGNIDIFYADGQQWIIFFTRKNKTKVIKKSHLLTEQLLFGDFNGDGKTDIVFRNTDLITD